MARRIALVVAVIGAALVLVAVALAAEFRYSSVYLSGPGATYQTGFAPRQYAYACRERSSNYGLARGRYYNANLVIVADTGVLNTNCIAGAAARLGAHSYARAWCRHEGTISWYFACATTRP